MNITKTDIPMQSARIMQSKSEFHDFLKDKASNSVDMGFQNSSASQMQTIADLDLSSDDEFLPQNNVSALFSNKQPQQCNLRVPALMPLQLNLGDNLSVVNESMNFDRINKDQISKVTEFLYISGLESAQDPNQLEYYKISHVISLCKCSIQQSKGIKQLQLNIVDSADESICDHLYQCFDFIEQARESKGRVLIHCEQGISRSPTIVISYLIMCNDITYQEAYGHVKTYRKIISPNAGFMMQIVNWWKERHSNSVRIKQSSSVSKSLHIQGLLKLEETIKEDISTQDLSSSEMTVCKMSEVELQSKNNTRILSLDPQSGRLTSAAKVEKLKKQLIYIVVNLSFGSVVLVHSDLQHLQQFQCSESNTSSSNAFQILSEQQERSTDKRSEIAFENGASQAELIRQFNYQFTVAVQRAFRQLERYEGVEGKVYILSDLNQGQELFEAVKRELKAEGRIEFE